MGEITKSVFAPTGQVLLSFRKKVTAKIMARNCSDFDKSASHIGPQTPQLAMPRKVPTPDLLPSWRKFLVTKRNNKAKFVSQGHIGYGVRTIQFPESVCSYSSMPMCCGSECSVAPQFAPGLAVAG